MKVALFSWVEKWIQLEYVPLNKLHPSDYAVGIDVLKGPKRSGPT